jgi:ADP-heptose:LPS heptosyltransferase
VSFGTGDNPEKRVSPSLETRILQRLTDAGVSVLLDGGAGGAETERARELIRACPSVTLYEGPFAPFAAAITGSKLYMGYDSAGGHVAAAAGTPLVSIFAGYPSERMFARWTPYGPGARRIVKVDRGAEEGVWERTRLAIDDLLAEAGIRGDTLVR